MRRSAGDHGLAGVPRRGRPVASLSVARRGSRAHAAPGRRHPGRSASRTIRRRGRQLPLDARAGRARARGRSRARRGSRRRRGA